MIDRRFVRLGAIAWAGIGLAVALSAFGHVNSDARVVVGIASVAFPLAAALASFALARHRDRAAGVLLLISVATPTYFAYAINLPALIVGLALVFAPGAMLRPTATAARPVPTR